MPAKLLAGMDIADMHLDDRRLHREQRVQNRDRRRRMSRRIDDKPDCFFRPRFIDPIDDLAFVIGLAEDQRKTVSLGRSAAELFDVDKRRPPLYMRLAGAEQIEVWSVKDVNSFGHAR